MAKPIARLTDYHTCPLSSGPTPHLGGPIIGPGATQVLAGMLPVALVGDQATCTGAVDTLVWGSMTVFVNNRSVTRMGDWTTHGGVITKGLSSVLVGDEAGPGQAQALVAAARCGRPFVDL